MVTFVPPNVKADTKALHAFVTSALCFSRYSVIASSATVERPPLIDPVFLTANSRSSFARSSLSFRVTLAMLLL